MSLSEELAGQRESSRAMTPPEALDIMDKAADDLLRSGIAERSVKVGEEAPEFALPNAMGKVVSLEELLEKGPLVLSFYRGGW